MLSPLRKTLSCLSSITMIYIDIYILTYIVYHCHIYISLIEHLVCAKHCTISLHYLT